MGTVGYLFSYFFVYQLHINSQKYFIILHLTIKLKDQPDLDPNMIWMEIQMEIHPSVHRT